MSSVSGSDAEQPDLAGSLLPPCLDRKKFQVRRASTQRLLASCFWQSLARRPRGAMADIAELDAAELEHIIGFTGQDPNALSLHPRDANIALYGIGHVVVLADQTDPHRQDLLRGHDSEVTAVVFSPSGRLVASGQRKSAYAEGEQIVVWEYESRKPVYRLAGVEGTVKCLQFSEDDRFLAAIGEGNTNGNDIALWDMQNGSVAQYLKCPKIATCLTWGATVVADAARRVKTPKYSLFTFHSVKVDVHYLEYDIKSMHYQLKTQPVKFPSAGLARTYHACQVSPATGELLAGTSVGELVVFNAENQIYRAALPISTNGILSLCCQNDFVFVGAGDGKVKKLQGNDQYWTIVGEAQLNGRITTLTLRADGEELMVGTDTAKMYSLRCEDLSFRLVQESNVSQINCVAFGSKSDVFATVSQDGCVRVMDLSDYSVLAHARGSCGAQVVTFAGDDILLTGWEDGAVRLFDANNCNSIGQMPKCHRGRVTCIAVGGEFYYTAGDDGAMRVWNRSNLQFIGQYSEHNKTVTGLLVDNMHEHLVHSCSIDRAVVTYDLRTSRRSNYKMHRDGGFTGLAQRLDSEQELLTTTSDGFVMSWDCDVQLPVMALDCARRMKFTCIGLSSGGRFLAVGCEDLCVRIWDLHANEVVAVCRGHSGAIASLAWAPDEKQLVSVGADAAVCVWNFYLGGAVPASEGGG